VRHVAPGDIVDHVLEGRVTLIVPITAPATAKVTDEATPLTIRGKANWLVCNEACLPGSSDLSVVIAVVAKPELAKDTPDAPEFAAARAKHSKPLPTDGSVVVQPGTGSVTFSSAGAAGITFFPEADSREPSDMVSGVSTESGALTVAFDNAEADKPIRGVLEVVRPAPTAKPAGSAGAGSGEAAGGSFAAKGLVAWYTIALPAAKSAVSKPVDSGK
jgi:thiol:disulfide interchange protein DsbD